MKKKWTIQLNKCILIFLNKSTFNMDNFFIDKIVWFFVLIDNSGNSLSLGFF